VKVGKVAGRVFHAKEKAPGLCVDRQVKEQGRGTRKFSARLKRSALPMTIKFKKAFAVTGVLALLVVLAPATALAQSSREAYGDNAVAGLEQNSDNSPAATDKSSPKSSPAPANSVSKSSAAGETLPFTGADLGVVAAAGALLVGFGFGLRRLAHPPTRA
jgi:hypothetical protein